MIIGIVVTVVFLALMALSFSLAMGFGALITISAAILTGIMYIRTRNNYFLPGIAGHLIATPFLIMLALGMYPAYKTIIILLVMLMLAFHTLMILFTLQKKTKWRSREVLELAATPVGEFTNGYTNRPMQAGKANYSIDELLSFSKFIRQHLIAIPLREKERIIFIINIPWGAMVSFNSRYLDRSYVAFDFEGNISVNISQQDYFLYKDRLAFDQLCTSMGQLFIGFMEHFQRGETSIIIDQFNALKMNIITEG